MAQHRELKVSPSLYGQKWEIGSMGYSSRRDMLIWTYSEVARTSPGVGSVALAHVALGRLEV